MNSNSYLDSREIDKRIDELTEERLCFLRDKINGRNKTLRRRAWEETEEYSELTALVNLREEMNEPYWKDGITFIPEGIFEDYAREYAVDIGVIEDDVKWPACHINWSCAADDLKSDFHHVIYQNTVYLYRL